MTDKGTAYSDSFYEIENGRVINPFTNKTLGLVVRVIPSNNYLCIKPDTIWSRITSWFSDHQEIHDRREINYINTPAGSLKETMKILKESK
jgi:hypothetical protein